MAEPETSGHKGPVERVTEADSIRKVPGPNTKAEILLRFVAASLLLHYLHSHFVWFRLPSSIVELLFVYFGGSRIGVSARDSGIYQTSTASPAEPGGAPNGLGEVNCRGIDVELQSNRGVVSDRATYRIRSTLSVPGRETEPSQCHSIV